MLASNALRLSPGLPPALGASRFVDVGATLDVSTGGRLLGVEIDFAGTDLHAPAALRGWIANPTTTAHVSLHEFETAYIELTPDDGGVVRSNAAVATVELIDNAIAAIIIPRRGHGYEISYPSGNR